MGWLAAAVACQVGLIGGVFAWSYFLAKEAIGSAPVNTTALITVWVSDPSWHVAPELEVGEHSWIVRLTTQQTSSFGLPPDAEAVVALWGDAELSDPQPHCLLGLDCDSPMSSVAPGSYQQVQVPEDQASFYVENLETGNVPGFPGPTIPVQIFSVTARNFYYKGANDPSVFPVAGEPSAGMVTTTSTGWSAFVPSAGSADISGTCSPAPAIVPQAIASVIGSAAQGWFDMSCPSPSIELLTQAGQTFSDSTVPPTTMEGGIPTWTTSASGLPDVGGFWLDVADLAIAATSQRDLFFAGVLAGIAGGLLAGWFAAAVTFVVKRSMAPGAPPGKTRGKAAHGSPAATPTSAPGVSTTSAVSTAAGSAPPSTAAARAAGLVVRDAGTADT
jgi:hypothetical protein